MKNQRTHKLPWGVSIKFIITFKPKFQGFLIVVICADIDERYSNFTRRLWSQRSPSRFT